MLIDTELPKERIYYKRQGKFIHLMWAPKGFFRTDDSEIAVCMKKQIKLLPSISWFSHVTKLQTKKLSLLLIFYFHVILEHLKTIIQTNVRFKRVLCFAIQDAWIWILKSLWVPQAKNSCISRKTQKQMFLLASGGHICAPERDTNMASPYKAL